MCNNNCCTCCQCGTHDDDTPQEITYTSVCNSDVCKDKDGCRCCCCKNKGVCEDDPNVRLDGMEERMEECCEEVNERITNLECELCEEISRSTTKDEEHDEKIEDLYERESLDFNKSVFNHETLMIEFWHVFPDEDHKDPIHYSEWDIDASNFLKDWFIDDAKLISNRYLELTFNNDPITDPDHNPITISIDLYDFIDPGLYYTKTEIDNKITQINNAINTISTNLTNLKNSINGYNPELPYDGTAVTVGLIDGKQFKVHLATFPELVLTVSPDYANNRFAVTTNKGNTNYVELKNSTYETIQHAANTYETINHAALTYETKTEAADHLDNVTQNVQNGRILTFSRLSGQNPITITIPDDNTDTLVELNVCTDDVEIPILLAYGANPTSGTAGEANYSSVTINPHTNVVTADLNGNATTATNATNDGNGDNIANTYETIADANNHIKNASFDNSTRKMTFTKQNNTTFDVTIPDANANNYVSNATVSDHTLTLTREGLSDLTVQLPDNNNYVTGASVSGHTLTLSRNGGLSDLTVTLPDDDHNYYVTGGSVSGNTLTLTRSGGLSDVTIQLPAWITTDNNNYVTSATVSGTTLTLTRNGLADLTCQLPAGADGNNYVTSATFANNTLTLGRNGGLSDVTCSIPIPAADNTNPITDVSQSGDTVTFTYKDNTSESITVGGNTNVTYGGNTVTLQQAITSIENRLNALEGLWEINPNDSTQVVAKNNRSAKAAGFYDSTVNTV